MKDLFWKPLYKKKIIPIKTADKITIFSITLSKFLVFLTKEKYKKRKQTKSK